MSILAENFGGPGAMVLLMLVAAAVMFLLEVCTPSFGLLALLGLTAEGVAVFYAFQIHSILGIVVLAGCIIGTPFFLYLMIKLLPNTPLGKRLFLKKARSAHAEATPDADELKALIGKTATAETTLRPSGVIRVEGRRIDALAEHEMIDKGQVVRIIDAGGTDVVVRLAENE